MVGEKYKRITKRIKIYGIVQGVGFRPLVYRIAKKYKIHGTVQNVGGYVEIIAEGKLKEIEDFLKELTEKSYGNHEILSVESEIVPEMKFNNFSILHSRESEEVSVIPPDLPVCPECQKELFLSGNRRYQNPFISCMSCGPRYTIIRELPYDRENTAMEDFPLCKSCNREYQSPLNRRFHAQTISCDDCGPYLIFQGPEGENCREKEAFMKAASILKEGGILAVKGIGGYHLVCSPFLEDTVQKLRLLKGREEKPFAVMFETLESVKDYCHVSEEEEKLLQSKARPIVLLYTGNKAMAPSTIRGSIYCGAFLPYTPLQLLLTYSCGPLIMTSANCSGKPIIYKEEEVLALKSPFLDGVLYHTRRIIRSVDDSVAKIVSHHVQLIRRSRGYVPYPVFLDPQKSDAEVTEPSIFAAGGDLKAAFCLYQKNSAVVSQYFGDLEEEAVMQEYMESVLDLSKMLKFKPTLAICDLHPNYHSVRFTKNLGIEVQQVQHHHAHIASVMAEHGIRKTVIGVAFDGTGYGTDGNIWGGEFLVCEGNTFQRAAHLNYTPILGGDGSMKDAAKAAACFLIYYGLDRYLSDSRTEMIKAAVTNQVNTVLTSSMGRLFDAVSALLCIAAENRFEGECAASLEREAVYAIRNGIKPVNLRFTLCEADGRIHINPADLLEQLCSLRKKADTRALALGFHYAAAEMIGAVCEKIRDRIQCSTVALSGGVFQNTILTEITLSILNRKGFETYINREVPPNDGGISLGQAYLGLLIKKTER